MSVRRMIPPSLSPAERAKLKAVRALCFLVGINVAFALSAFVLAQWGQPWDWHVVFLVALGTLLYSILDVGEKYFSARGQMTIAEIFEMGKQEGMAYLHLTGDVTNPAIEQVVTTSVQAIVKDEEHEEHDETPPPQSA